MRSAAPRGARTIREAVLAALFFLGATALLTWPQVLRLSDGMTDIWDAKLSAWILHWDYVQTFRDPLNLFQAPILHPAKYVLAFSENMYGAAVFGFPLLASGASLIFNYNVLLLLGMFLSALSAWALARYVIGDPLASLVAGLIYAFLPYKISQLPHIHMEWGAFLCLVFLYLLRYLDGGRRRDAVLFGMFLAWNAIACVQYAFFTGFLVAVVLVLEMVHGGGERGRRLRGALLAIVIASAAFLPFAIPYKKASELYGMRRTVSEMTFFSARPGYFLSAGERNKLYGPITARWRGPEGDLFPGLIALGLAGVAVARLRRASVPLSAGEVSLARHRAARAFDVLILILLGIWFVVRAVPHLKVGPMHLGDTGRVQVFLTIAVLARLAFAFPRKSRFSSLADFLRRQSLDRRALLLLFIAVTGVLVALGGHTPYYRFLFQSFGALFRAIRVAARGIVVFQVALAVLAAWGLALLTRNRSRPARRAWVAATLALITLEYRAFPVSIYDYDASPVPVYEWLKKVDISGAVIEWPVGFPHDCEYTLRQAEHGKPLVNGHSSFTPKAYGDLVGWMRMQSIPEAIWGDMAALGASLLVYHPYEGEPLDRVRYRRMVRQGLTEGRLELLRSFPRGVESDFAFRLTSAPPLARPAEKGAAARAQQDLARLIAISDASLAPPFGVIHAPEEGQQVPSGFWGFGWALDDSGIAGVRVGTELGDVGAAQIGGNWPGLRDVYPDYRENGNGGYGFAVPDVPPGPHTLRITIVGIDGGETVLERPIVVNPPPVSRKR